MKKYGKTERMVYRGKYCVSEPMWSESVIHETQIDKQKVNRLINKIKKGITKMEKQGHTLPRRNIHYMIDLIVKKELGVKIKKAKK